MKTIHLLGTFPGATLTKAQRAQPIISATPHSYNIDGYFGRLHYQFIFNDDRVYCEHDPDALGHLLLRISEVPPYDTLPNCCLRT